MKTNEDRLTKLLLKSEGGYCNDAHDPGGPTNFGITIFDARKYWKPNATAEDVRNMPLSVALDIYDKRYWDAMLLDAMPSGLDYVVYDYGVNSGIARPPAVLRRLLNLPAKNSIDTALIEKVRTVDADKLIDAVCDERLHFMKNIKGGALWESFGRGWSSRVSSVRSISHTLSKSPSVAVDGQDKVGRVGKATHVDPTLPGKITKTTTVAAGGTTIAASAGSHEWLIALGIAAATIIVIGGIGYIIYRNQHKRQVTVELPPGTEPLIA